MTRIPLVNPESAAGPVKQTLDELTSRRGELGPMVRGMANSSALLRRHLDLNRAMKRSHLERRISERISLLCQQAKSWASAYCRRDGPPGDPRPRSGAVAPLL